MTDMIVADHLVKDFGQKRAVDNVSLTVKRGEVLGFLGPNGAGKSTTMKMLTGFLRPSAGRASIAGYDVTTAAMSARKVLGYLPEGAPLYPDMTPWSLLHFCAEVRNLPSDLRRKRIIESIERTNLQSVVMQPIDTLSKGFKRRVGLAQALLHDPEVLILDEPTDGLDPNQKHEVRELIREIAPNKAIIISTHILEEVDAICSRAVIIADGKVIADGAPGQLAERSPLFNALSVVLPNEKVSQALSILEAQDQVQEVRSQTLADGLVKLIVVPVRGKLILSIVTSCLSEEKLDIVSIRPEATALEDLFRQLTVSSDKREAA
jgi:ABC-2 type transport system ATP-binding protein